MQQVLKFLNHLTVDTKVLIYDGAGGLWPLPTVPDDVSHWVENDLWMVFILLPDSRMPVMLDHGPGVRMKLLDVLGLASAEASFAARAAEECL